MNRSNQEESWVADIVLVPPGAEHIIPPRGMSTGASLSRLGVVWGKTVLRPACRRAMLQKRDQRENRMGRKVYVIGVGMTKFEKPGSKAWDYPDMAKESGTKALEDAGIPYSEVEQAVVGYVYGESTCGQRAVYQLGLTGIPVYNVNNNCSTGSTALFLGRELVEGGIAGCVLALGFEKMEKGS